MKLNRKKIIFLGIAFLGMISVFGILKSSGLMKSSSSQASDKDIYYCPMHPTYTANRPGTCPICNMNLVKQEAGNPEKTESHTGHGDASAQSNIPGNLKTFTVEELMAMKPGEICLLHKCKHGTCMFKMTEEAARLGKCPHCGEDLDIIVKAATPQGHATVTLGSGSQQAIGVETEPVKKMAIAKTLRTVGRIAYDPELYQAQQEYLQSREALKKAENAEPEIKNQAAQLVDSSKIKLRLLGFSEELIKELEQTGKPDRSLLYSDAGGKVWLYAPIYEYEIPLVKVGDDLTVEVSSAPGKKFQGVIRSIDSVLDPMTRSVRVRAVLDNPEGLLKPEMYANASLEVNLGENLVVSKEAVFLTGTSNIVFVQNAGGQYEPREVHLGIEADNYYQVESGLGEGELVVTNGNFLIDSESRLKSALQGMGSGGGHSHGNS